ncbi:MAG: SLC13 family permease, partial [Chloroflexi bacterium]|nr:SLC13 family permease [Chloroflexota bacterium]
MTIEIAGFLVLFLIAMILFSFEWMSADIVALGLMLTLIISGLLPMEEAFAGFGSQTVLMILGLLILTEGLVRTGMVDLTGRYILRHGGRDPQQLRTILLVVPAILSSFISNTAAAAFFMPITLGVANRAHMSVSRLLMPLAFASILASSVTLIGTSTNLVVSGLMEQQGLAPLSMFELTPVGLPILVVGLLYMYFVGHHLIPDRTGITRHENILEEQLYVSEVRIKSSSVIVGRSIEQSVFMRELNLGMLRLIRGGAAMQPLADTILIEDDVLFVEGHRDDILQIPNTPGLELQGVIEPLDEYLRGQAMRIAEVIILPGSPLIGRTIKGLRLRERYKLQILAINQAEGVTYTKIGRRVLRLGDVLLIQIPAENLRLLQQEKLFRVLDITDSPAIKPQRIWLAGIIFAGSLLLAISGLLPIAVAVLLGAFLMFVSRCLSPEEAYRNIEWKALILIGSMLAFGQAMQTTGSADYLADQLVDMVGSTSPIAILSLFFALALILTQPMSNQAAAAVLIPIALSTAVQMDMNPRPFAVMIA